MEEIYNHTQRLHDHLDCAKKNGKINNNTWNKIRVVWAKAFEVEESDSIAIFHNLTLLSRSLDWTEQQIQRANFRRKEIYTRNFPKIKKAIAYGNIDGTWNALDSLINEESLADLLHCADRISDLDVESKLSKKELTDIKENLDSVFDTISKTELDEELKVAILDLLETSRQILADYRIRGSESLKEIIELALGKLMVKRTLLQGQSNKSWFKDLSGWLTKVDSAYSKLRKYGPLLQGTSKALLGITTQQSE